MGQKVQISTGTSDFLRPWWVAVASQAEVKLRHFGQLNSCHEEQLYLCSPTSVHLEVTF